MDGVLRSGTSATMPRMGGQQGLRARVSRLRRLRPRSLMRTFSASTTTWARPPTAASRSLSFREPRAESRAAVLVDLRRHRPRQVMQLGPRSLTRTSSASMATWAKPPTAASRRRCSWEAPQAESRAAVREDLRRHRLRQLELPVRLPEARGPPRGQLQSRWHQRANARAGGSLLPEWLRASLRGASQYHWRELKTG